MNHFVGLLTPALDDALERFDKPVLVDVGSGNAYLGFILYELFLKGRDKGELHNVESRDELTEKARTRAKELGYDRMQFATSGISKAAYPDKVHVLTALHACDTATDDAIAVALAHKAEHIALVPCCQAEVAQQLKDARPKVDSAMQSLFSHPWHRREFGSHLTNVIRALVLEANGYQVTVTELAGWEHSLKNELILARRTGQPNGIAKKRLEALLESTGVSPRKLPLPANVR
ncbi:MAG: SAM-dependent methyltransferase [Archangium sp.]